MWLFEYCEVFVVDNFGYVLLVILLEGNFIFRSLLLVYELVVCDLLKCFDVLFVEVFYQLICLYGDCYLGNLLCCDEVYYMVDFDDCCMGLVFQDLWMMFVGECYECLVQIVELVDGYNEFYDFELCQLLLFEGLCSFCLMYYSVWFVWCWDDLVFLLSFFWFGSECYWGEQVLVLCE